LEDNKIFEKSVEKNKAKGEVANFSFFDGPPFATGLPHHGHILQSFMKDSVPRFQTMRGKSVRRVWGLGLSRFADREPYRERVGFKVQERD
jgi:isoleucyl-tRNA synthetase